MTILQIGSMTAVLQILRVTLKNFPRIYRKWQTISQKKLFQTAWMPANNNWRLGMKK
jgi:hypothetical protein